jgi:hypothetical protein
MSKAPVLTPIIRHAAEGDVRPSSMFRGAKTLRTLRDAVTRGWMARAGGRTTPVKILLP